MADRISSFPDPILCHILSFVPTKQVVATSVLSKRWNLLWRSVPSFDFYHEYLYFNTAKETHYHFLLSVCSFMLSRDRDQPLHRFRLTCRCTFRGNECINNFTSQLTSQWIKAAVSGSGRVQHLHLDMDWRNVVPSAVFTCKTLVVLKLTYVSVQDISTVDLPLLKILHLNTVLLSKDRYLSQLLSGSPNLQDLEVNHTRVNDGEGLRVSMLFCQQDLALAFQNLLQLRLDFVVIESCVEFLEMLKHFPKLQALVICYYYKTSFGSSAEGHEEAVLSYPQYVPECISSHLKTCRVESYRGSIDEFQFARYIMQNAKYLRTMEIKICTSNSTYNSDGEKPKMKRDLSSCMKNSDTFKLSFE